MGDAVEVSVDEKEAVLDAAAVDETVGMVLAVTDSLCVTGAETDPVGNIVGVMLTVRVALPETV